MFKSRKKRDLVIKPKRKSWPKEALKVLFLLCIIGFLGLIVATLGAFAYFSKDLPNPNKLSDRNIIESTKIFDRTGQIILYEVHGEEKRTLIPYNQIPDYVKWATICAEDDEFFSHFGIDFKGMLRSFWINLRTGQIKQGGSTITQQLVKNTILTSQRTYTRKIQEIILALEIEQKFEKEQILQMYLNEISYGPVYGIEAAAQTFFGKPAKDLDLAEAVLLSALPKAPTYYSPYGANPDKLKSRQEMILDKMAKLNFINQEQAEQAKQQKLAYIAQGNIKAPHFVMYVKQYLADKYGEKNIEQGGLKVITTLDMDLQKIAEQVVREGASINLKKYKAENAALVSLDPKTGEILAMVGSKDYFDKEIDGNVNVTLRPRQPGSSFKPYTYAAAFKAGYTPETVIFDLTTNFGPDGSGKDYIPRNYDQKERGPLTMRQAMSMSLNIPAVKTLYLAGIKNTIKTAADLGITTLNRPEMYGLALTLGGAEVKLLDHASAFGVFAAEGIKYEKTAILKIQNSQGEVLEEHVPEGKRVLDVQIARLINDVLSDNESRTPMFGPLSKLYLGARPAAAKTGTTNDNRDAWTMGFTPSLTAGVWAGNNDNSRMQAGTGAGTAAPIWHEFMTLALEGREIENFNPPKPIETQKPVLNGRLGGEIKIKIDKISGKLATELTPPSMVEEKIIRQVHNILYWVDKDNPQGDIPKNPGSDPQFNRWEMPVQVWAAKNNLQISIPREYDDVHTKENKPRVKIISPKSRVDFTDGMIAIQVEIEAVLEIEQLDFFFDSELIGTDKTEPYALEFNLPKDLEFGKHQIKVKVYDVTGNMGEAREEIEVE